jgi:hypothetical protein
LTGAYQIDIDSLPFERTALDLDWRIVDDNGAVIREGAYSDSDPAGGYRPLPAARLERRGNAVTLGEYRPNFGKRQRIIMRVHQDVQGDSAVARLEIGQPEVSLELSYGIFLILGWAGIVGGAGRVMLLVLLIRRSIRRKTAARASYTETCQACLTSFE